MNTKQWVQCVKILVVVVALLWVPVAVQAAPVQNGGEESSTQWMPVDWFAGLSQIWEGVRAALGFGSAPQPPKVDAPQIPLDPGSNQMTTESVSLDSSGDVTGTIDPVG